MTTSARTYIEDIARDLKVYQAERQEEEDRSSITLGDMAGDLRSLRDRARQKGGAPGGTADAESPGPDEAEGS